MTEKVIYAVLALALAGMAALFAAGAWDEYAGYARYRDFESWTQSPGHLKSLRLRQVVSKSARLYRIDCEYVFEFAWQFHSGNVFDLRSRAYPSVEEAKAKVLSVVGPVDSSRWRAEQRDQFTDWLLDTSNLAVRVRHSRTDLLGSSLTSTPPPPAELNWLLIVVYCVAALVMGLASPVMVAAIFLGRKKVS